MALLPAPERKLYYTVPETALICERPLGLVRRWIFRGQLEAVTFADEILVPAGALEDRLECLARRRALHTVRGRDSNARSR